MIDLKPACRQMADVLGGITDDQLARPTPCTQYTVGDVVDHVALLCRGATALAQADAAGVERAGVAPDAAHLGADWRDVARRDVLALGPAWDDADVWLPAEGVPGSPFRNERWGKIALTELVVHGWDLAVATGQPFALPEPTLRACLDHVAEFVPNAPVPGLWGPPVAVAAGAAPLDQILAITGRDPSAPFAGG